VLLAGPGWVLMGMLMLAAPSRLRGAAVRGGASARPSPRRCTWPASAGAGPAGAGGGGDGAVRGLSQIKINVTNAYAGSLAWSNFFARITHSHPGRVVWLVFNVVIATC
jgi:hypothetical protein